jgi:MFS family permease
MSQLPQQLFFSGRSLLTPSVRVIHLNCLALEMGMERNHTMGTERSFTAPTERDAIGWTPRLRNAVALSVVAVELAVMFVGATLPTPLYPLYREAFGFGGVTLTLIFAVYVIGNLAALLIFGRLSDQIGRRRATLPAIAVALASTLVFALAQGTAWLFAARVLSGFATGLAAGAATAWIAELQPRGDKSAAALLASAANLSGLVVGALLSGTLAQVAPWALRLSYVVYVALLVIVALAILAAPETVRERIGRMSELSLRPRLGVPKDIRLAFTAPAVTAFATFALMGFYAAIIPNLLGESLHQKAPLVAGAVVAELFLVAALAVIATGKVHSRAAMLSGLILLLPSLALLVAAQFAQSLWLLLAATALGGISAALGYRGSLQVVNAIAPADQRSEVVSSYLVACYLGNALPVIGIGLLSAAASSLVAHVAFAVVIGALAAAALAVGAKYAPRG